MSFKSSRTSYVRNFYIENGSNYINPHDGKFDHTCINEFNLDKTSKILDLACGSGEITMDLLKYLFYIIK